MTTTDRDGFTAGLRAIASFLDDHPEVPLPYLGEYAQGSSLPALPIYLVEGNQKAQLATIARAMGAATKAPITYSNGDERFQVWREFAGIVLMAQASRDEVCTRVVTGTEDREVDEVVTPAVTRKVTKAVEVVDWRCEPLLATPAELVDAAIEHDPDGVADSVMKAVYRDATPPPSLCDADWGSATLSQRCTLPAGHDGQHLDRHGAWSPAEASTCRECGSADCPLTERGVCWNRASCNARVATLLNGGV